jgi:hypothetical protein
VGKDWNIDEGDLPFFQTLHSMAYRAGGYSPRDVIGGKDMKAVGDATGIIFGSKN